MATTLLATARHFLALLALGTVPGVAGVDVVAAQEPAAAEAAGPVTADVAAGDHLQVYVATYGQGSAVWERFGHNAIWVRDNRTGQTRSYNWGSFDFDQVDFVPRLLRGNMLYSLEVHDASDEVAAYQYWDRSITVQELELSSAQKLALKQFVEWNALEENKFYEYHYYRDNCSTRVRDVLDRTLDGGLAPQLQALRSDETFRSHSLRLTADAPLTYTGIDLGLADSADHPLTAWEEAFVPMELMRGLRSVRVTGADGTVRPLVKEEVQLFRSSRGEPLAAAPNRVPLYLALGTALGLLFALLAQLTNLLRPLPGGVAARRGRWQAARWALAVSLALWSLVVGCFGTLVLLLWTATGHAFTYGNENLFQLNPLPLLLAGLAPAAALGSRRGARLAQPLALLTAALSLLGLLLKVLPGFDQVNYAIIALMLPAHLGVLGAVYQSRDRERHRGRTRTRAAAPGAATPV